ncbi:SWIM-type domain-containing protein [Trichonephila clavipes]|nr:SWIM-type domain-containing protein [Trichonephila clavipes]
MWVDAFRAMGNVSKEIKGPPRIVRTPENVECVRVSSETGNVNWPACSTDLSSPSCGRISSSWFTKIAPRPWKTEGTTSVKLTTSSVNMLEKYNINCKGRNHREEKSSIKCLSMPKLRSSTIDLQEEFKRLSLNKLQTINEDLINLITNRQGLSIFTFNNQSITAHAVDLQDLVIRNSNILVLSETSLDNESDISIHNFNCIVKYKRPNTRAGGVAIYQSSSDVVNIIAPSMNCSVSQSDIYGTIQSSVGGLCLAGCAIDNGHKIIIVAVYITPNKKLDDIIEFLHCSLLPYASRGSALLNKNYDKIPMILSGDFNVNFALDKSLKLIEFLKDNFTLSLQNNRITSTTK